ncbi:MAG: hypothetical protein JW934_14030 [Anaerolineae bacterium]|nr:hypothetical protein [Anaerolineae bacterium]
MRKQNILGGMVSFLMISLLVLGCSPPTKDAQATSDAGSVEGFPVKDPANPFALDEKGMVTLRIDQPSEIAVQRDGGEPLFKLLIKAGGVTEAEVKMTVQTITPELPEDLAASYVPVGQYALEMHVVGDTGYGFSLRPKIEFYFNDEEIAAAKSQGAALDTLKGNLFILYMEQRAGKWVPQKSVSLDEAAAKITVSNIAGTGAWWLVAVKTP